MNMKNSKVAIMECPNYDIENMMGKINAGIDLIGGWGQWIKAGMNVLLKVNLIGPLTPDSAAVTHCEFVRAITRILKHLGCNVWIGDSAGGAIGGKAQTAKSLTISGLEKIAQEEGAIIKNFDREGVVEIKNSSGKIMHLAKPMFDADFVINLPKMKTHLAGIYTGAVKNLFGCVPGQKKAEYHKASPTTSAFGEIICDINIALNVGLNIMDGIMAMDKMGPISGGKYSAQKIVMSTDALALDTIAAKMMGLQIQDLPIFQASIHREIGEWRIEKIEICGDYDVPPRLINFKLPRMISREGKGSGILAKLIDIMKTRPRIDLKICKKCNLCVDSCPVQIIDRQTKKIDYEKCIECMCCHELCIYKAVKLVNVNRVIRFLSRLKRQ